MIINGGFLTMGTKRIGLARFEALLENLKRTLTLGTATISAASLTATTGGLVVTAGEAYFRENHPIIRHQGAPATTADSTAALTAANVKAQIVQCEPTGARAKDLPAASTLISTLKLTADGDSADFTFLNLASSTHVVTLATASSSTLVGSGAISFASAVTFRVRRTSGTEVDVYRIAG
jgi:hypothetical protein